MRFMEPNETCVLEREIDIRYFARQMLAASARIIDHFPQNRNSRNIQEISELTDVLRNTLRKIRTQERKWANLIRPTVNCRRQPVGNCSQTAYPIRWSLYHVLPGVLGFQGAFPEIRRQLTQYLPSNVSVKPPHGLRSRAAAWDNIPKLEYLPCSLREIFVTLGDGQK